MDEDFELHLSSSSKQEAQIHKKILRITSFTICFWKKGGGIYVKYRVGHYWNYLWLNVSQEIIVDFVSPKSYVMLKGNVLLDAKYNEYITKDSTS